MSWSVVILCIGLVCSFGAFAYASKGSLNSFKLLIEEKQDAITKERQSILLKIGDSMKSAFVSFMVATVLLYFCLIGAGVFIGSTTQINQNALCALRGDLELRTESSEKFLKEHPKGIPGISAQTIEEGLHNQKRSIAALSSLSC